MNKKMLIVVAAALGVAGIATPVLAVSGGQAVPDPTAAPWMVTIATTGEEALTARVRCGGLLIAPGRVVTAGHCLDGIDPNQLEVHLGASTLSTRPGRILPIRGFSVHPDYRIIPSPVNPGDFSASAAASDVAIIELARPARRVPVVPVALRAPAPGTPVAVYGHGLTGQVGPDGPAASVGDVLQRGDLKVIDDSSCRSQLGDVVDGPSVICAQSTATVCRGDSGGPLVHDTPRGPELVGIVSFAGEVIGRRCGQAGYPGGFADAAALRSWIVQPHPTLAPMPIGKPKVTGVRVAGSTMTCQSPAWAGAVPTTVKYQWYRDDVAPDGFDMFVPIEGAGSPTLAVTPELAGTKLLCELTASTAGGTVILLTDPV